MQFVAVRMASDNRRSSKRVKDEDNVNSKKKTLTRASSSRRLSRETLSKKQTKESPVKEGLSNTRKSRRLEGRNPSGATLVKEETVTMPVKRSDRLKKVVEEAGSPSLKSKKGKKVSSLKQCLMDTSEEKKDGNKGSDVGGRKRKREAASVTSSSEPQRVETEEGEDSDHESKEKSSKADSSSSSDVEELEKPDEVCQPDNSKTERSDSKSLEGKDDSDGECSDRTGEESTPNASKRQCRTSYMKESLSDATCDTELSDKSSVKDRTTCEADGAAEIVEMINGVKNIKLGVLSVSGVAESIWNTREVEVSDAKGLQKQYFVKYKGLAHIHNQWVSETQLRLEDSLLVENFSKNGSMKWSEEWTMPHKLLKKRLLLSLEPLHECQQNTGKVLKYHHEWLVQWQGLGNEQATWESESTPVFDSPEGHNLIKEYENHHGNTKIHVSSDDKTEEMAVKLPSIPACSPPGMENIHLGYVNNLHDAWNKGQTSIIFDDQERITRIVLFILSLKDVTLPFLLITTSDSISLWEAMFLKIAPCNALKVSLEDKDEKRTSRLLQVHKEGGQLAFQILLYHVDTFVKDLNVLKSIKWEAVTVDESQSSEISAYFSHIKSLTTNKRLLVFCGPLGVSMTSYLDVLSLLDCDVISKTELVDISKLKETLSKLIAYECKSGSSTKFVEFWVPIQISNVQLEQYCSMLLSNVLALGSYSKSDTVGALHDILVSNRKCCDHPYIVDQTLQPVLTKDLEPAKFLDVDIKASGKLQFLDLILPEMRKRQLRVLILFQPLSGSGKDSPSIGDILDDFIRQRFGEDSYERVDGIGMIPSKKQTALHNFNNKERGRFIFLLEYRACLPSIKLSSVDTIIIFDSDWNPANDLRALQKVAIDSQSEQIMIFRLYTSSTLEEKILRLAEHNTTIDSKLLNLSRSTSDALLMWGATYLFNKLDEFHSASGVHISSEENLWNKLTEEFLNLISHKPKNTDEAKLLITRVQPVCGSYGKNLPLPSMANGKQPHVFWRNLLVGRNPSWKYLSISTQRQRKRPCYSEVSPTKANTNNDDVGRKRKKNANIIVEPVASKPVLEEAEIARDSRVPSHDVSQSPLGDASCNEMSFRDLLKLNISKLCEVLRLSEDVKIVVERFLEYVIENYRVVKEPANTLHAFLISLCWIGSALLKHKLDRTQSVVLANKHLDFRCREEEAKSVYLKLETAKDMFIRHTQNQNKTNVSSDSIPPAQPIFTKSLDPMVKVEILESRPSQVDDAIIFVVHRNSENSKQISSDSNQKDAPGGAINLDMSDPLEAQNGSCNSDGSNSPCGHSVLQDLEIQKESAQPNEHQVDPSSLPESNNLQAVEVHPLHSAHTSLGEQQPDTHSSDRVDCQPSNEPSNPSQDPEALPQALEARVHFSNQAATPPGSQLLMGHGSDNHNQGVSRTSLSDPLQAELEKICELKITVNKCHEAIKVKLKSEHEKELAEMIARINQKYEARNQDVEAAFLSKKKEIDICFNRVVKSKVLAETFRCKCQDLTPFNPVEIQVVQSGGMQHLPRTNMQSSLGRSTEIASYLPARSSGSQQVTELQPPLQIVHHTANLFSTTPCGPPYNTNPSTMPTRTPSTSVSTSTRASTVIPAGTPSRPPSMAIPTSTPSQPPSTAISTSTPSRLPSTVIPTSTQNRPPSTTIPTSTPNRPPSAPIPTSASNRQPSTSIPTGTPTRPPTIAGPTSTPTRPLPTINPIAPSSRPMSNINPITPHSRSSRPPPNINPITPSTRSPRVTGEIRAPAPHIRPFRPSTSVSPDDFASHRVISSQHTSSSLPLSQTSAQPLQKPPPFPTNHNCHPTRDSPGSSPSASPLVTQASSQPPASVPVAPPVSFQLPPLHSLYPPGSVPATSFSHSQMSPPPMPSIPVSHTGLYSAPDRPTPDIFSQQALDLLKDMDKQAGFHQSNMYPPPSEFGKDGNGSGLGCLSDDDVLVCLSDDD